MQNENKNLENEINDLEMNEAEAIKGGPTHQSKRDVILKSSVADGQENDGTLREFKLNHNETVAEDSTAAELAAVNIEDMATLNANDIKGGPSTQSKRDVILRSSVIGGQDNDDTSRGSTFNHNETVVEDSTAAESAALDDLTLSNAEVIKGGQTREHILLARRVGATSTSTSTGIGGDWDGDGKHDIPDFIAYR